MKIKAIKNIRYITRDTLLCEMKINTFVVGFTADVILEDESVIEVHAETNKLLNQDEIEELVNKEVVKIKGCENLKQDNGQKEIVNLNVELDFHNDIVKLDKEKIKIKRINRTEYILNEASRLVYIDIDNAIENIKILDSKIGGKNYLYELKLDSNTMIYSDEFVGNMLKDEYIKYLKNEQKKIETMKQLKKLDIKIPSREEIEELYDINGFLV